MNFTDHAEGIADGLASEFDPAVATLHSYLGDLDDVSCAEDTALEEGRTYTLPLLPCDGIVLMPGSLLPLWLKHLSELRAVEAALEAATPLKNLLVVVCEKWFRGMSVLYTVGTTAQIRRIRHDTSGAIQAVARGRQRVSLKIAATGRRAEVQVLPDDEARPVPRPIASGQGYWPAWVFETYCAFHLADKARAMFLSISPQGAHAGQPLALSFWLAANLPLDCDTRQRLLEAPNVAHRLYMEIHVMRHLRLCCRECDQEVANVRDVITMSEEGTGGLFVNPHGHVHDMITLSRVWGLLLEGEPETACSWFPGYAWQICYCDRCLQHMGWKFTAVQPGLSPATFWGVRRESFAHCEA